ncbi:MAG TPA: DUF624 domain-containing protein [Chloroflexia bacterium]|nr:DUF624 domain-containing protein [Chloroflexia bacterium]
MIRLGLAVLVRALADLWDNLFVIVVANLIWGCSLVPGLGLANLIGGAPGVIVGVVLIVLLAGPATLALYHLTVEVTRQERLEFGEYWRCIKTHYRRGWIAALLNVVFIVITVVNFIFYSSASFANTPVAFLLYLWGYIAFTWFCMQLYLWPLTERMEEFRISLLLRNLVLATFKYPFFTLVIGVVMALFFALSFWLSFLPLIIFGMGYHALVSNRALSVVLQQERNKANTIEQQGGTASNYQVDVPPLPEKKQPEEDAIYSTRNAPPGVKRRGSINETENNKNGGQSQS